MASKASQKKKNLETDHHKGKGDKGCEYHRNLVDAEEWKPEIEEDLC